ncbi:MULTISPECIES: hypothetical protein [unclassified Microcystis]|uniref:hypothetical protein n=2 Tax=unclassified Microcystis TaxID=2643300 RepID=UPI00257DF8EC|nr:MULTISPECIES: hypothetical protein [unclassified Microcystis]MCA2729260.1 hypothetical protein [Microcystis sp. M162S2]MCA2775221.1 hypothetical protein [Microcystis sp. M135S2]MCA2792482.1 hypothetical protein [Microcystis sp. M112S2]MCA2898566.1 hypothetical protein [Microcystis sp. M039S1]MCA2902222.1 hypothetical protein [Microcystis sp. M035S1]
MISNFLSRTPKNMIKIHIIKRIWQIGITLPLIVQWIFTILIVTAYLFGIIYPLVNIANIEEFWGILFTLFFGLGLIYSAWNNVKHGTPVPQALRHFPCWVIQKFGKFFVFIWSSIWTDTIVMLRQVVGLRKFCYRLFSYLRKLRFLPILKFFKTVFNVILYGIVLFCFFTIFFPDKTFDDSEKLNHPDFNRKIKSFSENINSIYDWSKKTQNLLSQKANNINQIKNKFNQFYGEPNSPQLPKEIKGIEILDVNYKEFITSLNSIQSDLERIKKELFKKQQTFQSTQKDLPNLRNKLQTKCEQIRRKKDSNKNLFNLCDSLLNNLKQADNRIYNIPLGFSEISKIIAAIDKELKIAKNFQKSWEKEIDKIQAKLGIFPKNLNLLFTQAENLIEEVNDIQLKFKEEFSQIIDELGSQKSEFAELTERYNKLIIQSNINLSINKINNQSKQLNLAISQRKELTKLKTDMNIIIEKTRKIKEKIDNSIYILMDKIKQLEEINTSIKKAELSSSYTIFVEEKSTTLKIVTNKSKDLIEQARNIENQINYFHKSLMDNNLKIDSYVKKNLPYLEQLIQNIENQKRKKSLFIVIPAIIVTSTLGIFLYTWHLKRSLTKLHQVSETEITIKNFLQVVECDKELYEVRKEALEKISTLLSDDLQNCIVATIKTPEPTTINKIKSVKENIKKMRKTVIEINRRSNLQEGDRRIRNELLSKINGLELQLSELRDID